LNKANLCQKTKQFGKQRPTLVMRIENVAQSAHPPVEIPHNHVHASSSKVEEANIDQSHFLIG
jgi:hypothetical protein